ncbi:hypothetical protein [Mucilaginibacter gotjawali]|uniref:Uncharacterized protein n=2 Tax=Mucilaginibacter gotjawali TaxID=1550579 RepID=A0A839SFZ0_9SPHI|nr:hypothetical protein [Mucilaginibacter gotjawali]MBB3055457.1 hypothetical protein [Mucilaginibacter gotjawali]BAU53263.1 hypothetical protein MgSA37_01430 [Mucilaginibacter gotjawali]
MKKVFFMTMILLLFQLCGFAQYKASINRSCGFSKQDTTSEGYAWDADNQALEYVKRICDVSGISKNFTIQRSSLTATACAVIDADNNRIIYYNQDFFGSLNNETYKIAILAHEIAHHLNNNLFTKDSKRTIDELDADKFAGSVICKLGLKLEDAKQLYITECPSYSKGIYPARKDRIEAFSIGFYDAGCQNGKAPNQADNSNPILKPNLTTNTFVLPFTDGHFVGNGFTVTLPSNFIARPSIRSITTKAAQSFFFTSPDGDAEFYIFLSPWGNVASDIAIDAKTETLVSTNVGRGGEIVRYDIKAKDNSYERAYLEVQSQKENIHHVKGFKYKTQAAYNTYYPMFARFFQTTPNEPQANDKDNNPPANTTADNKTFKVSFSDSFVDNASRWPVQRGYNYNFYFRNNKYEMESLGQGMFEPVIPTSINSDGDYRITALISHFSGVANNGYGLTFSYKDSGNLYLFEISAEGYYRVCRFLDSQFYTILPWTASDKILKTNGQINKLRIWYQGNQVCQFYINDTLVNSIDNFEKEGNYTGFVVENNQHIQVSGLTIEEQN